MNASTKSLIKPWWFLAAFLAGLALAMVAEDLILDRRNNLLEFHAPHTDFFAGKPSQRLNNALEVPFLIRTTLWSGSRNHVYRTATDRFLISEDIWEKTYQVVQVSSPQKRASHLTAKAAQEWCLKQMSLDINGLAGNEPLWAQLDIYAEDAHDGSILSDSVNSAGISLTPLIELLGKSSANLPHWKLDYPPAFTLDSLRNAQGS